MISGKGAKFENVSGSPAKISDFIYSTGEVTVPLIEQALIINSAKGLIMITGCAHPGVINRIKKAREFYTREDIYLCTGGFHNPSSEVVKEFRELGKKKLHQHIVREFRQSRLLKKNMALILLQPEPEI